MNKKIITNIVLLLSLHIHLFSQVKEIRDLYKSDTLKISKNKNLKIIALPIVFTSPETGFGFGGGAQIFLLNKSNTYNSRLSNILFSGIYTAKKQIMIEINPKIYFKNGDYFMDAVYKLEIFPNTFWGIGNNSIDANAEFYNMTSSILNVKFLKRLPPHLNFGFNIKLEKYTITEIQDGGFLDQKNIAGSNGATIIGIGSIFNFDNRINTADPVYGHYLSLSANFSSKNIGATHGFNKFITDLRAYIPITSKSTLATQIYLEANYGDVPFQSMAQFGGSNRARGYFGGRFIDKHMYVIQAEYRWRLHPRWGLAFFGLLGEVADRPGNYFTDIKPSIGGGIRFKITKSQNTLLRLGIARGKDGNGGLYFGINQAF